VKRYWARRYLVIIESGVSSGLNDMIIPPIQSEICMKVTSPVFITFWKEDIFQNEFRHACERKQMGDVEQKRQGLGMVSLFLVLGHMELISTLTEAKIMGLIIA